MGWAGLSPKLLGRFRPKMDWADLGPKKLNIIFWARPGPEDRAGPGSAWPKPKRGGGNYFPPHPCMQNATRSACGEGNEKKNKRENEGGRKVTWRGGGCASLAVLRQRLVAVA